MPNSKPLERTATQCNASLMANIFYTPLDDQKSDPKAGSQQRGILLASVTPVAAAPASPPYMLQGQKLHNGWIVGKRLVKQSADTGGHFSVGYECTSPNGVAAFLKVIDLYKPLQNRNTDVLKALQPFIQAVQGERELLDECRHMDRVVTAIETGDLHELDGNALIIPIPYIIFERADHTARTVVYGTKRPKHGWCLRTLHQVAVGIYQLHGT